MNHKLRKKIYITKYVLTKGILVEDADVDPGTLRSASVKKLNYGYYYYGNEFHLSLAEAKSHAEKLRLKKIESLKKQIAKLEKLQF